MSMAPESLRASYLLVAALILLVSVTRAHCQVDTDGDLVPTIKAPQGSLETAAITGEDLSHASDTDAKLTSDIGKPAEITDSLNTVVQPLGEEVSAASEQVVNGAKPTASGSSSSFKKVTISQSRTISGPNQEPKTVSSQSVHVSTSSGDGVEEHASYESSDDGQDHDVDGDAQTAALELNADSLWHEGPQIDGAAPENSDAAYLPPPTIIDESPSGSRGPAAELEDADEQDSASKQHSSQESSYKPAAPAPLPNLPGTQPLEHIDETYIDASDPSDPKQVHYTKDVKAQIGPNGHSYQHSESKTANSIGANPNSYSHHSSSSSSSSSSSYSSSYSSSGGANYKQYGPTRNHKNNKKHNNRVNQNHYRPYYSSSSSSSSKYQHGHANIKPLAPLPSLPGFPSMPAFPSVPQMPLAPVVTSNAWVKVAQPKYGQIPQPPPFPQMGSLYGQVQHGSPVVYGSHGAQPYHSQLRVKRANKNKRHLSKRQAKRLARLERKQHQHQEQDDDEEDSE